MYHPYTHPWLPPPVQGSYRKAGGDQNMAPFATMGRSPF